MRFQWTRGHCAVVGDVPIPAVCVAPLREHLDRERVKTERLGQEITRDRLLFTNSRGDPYNPDNVKRAFRAMLDEAGLRRIRMYDLRHTCASLFLAQGVPARVVMEILGHSAIAVTMKT